MTPGNLYILELYVLSQRVSIEAQTCTEALHDLMKQNMKTMKWTYLELKQIFDAYNLAVLQARIWQIRRNRQKHVAPSSCVLQVHIKNIISLAQVLPVVGVGGSMVQNINAVSWSSSTTLSSTEQKTILWPWHNDLNIVSKYISVYTHWPENSHNLHTLTRIQFIIFTNWPKHNLMTFSIKVTFQNKRGLYERQLPSRPVGHFPVNDNVVSRYGCRLVNLAFNSDLFDSFKMKLPFYSVHLNFLKVRKVGEDILHVLYVKWEDTDTSISVQLLCIKTAKRQMYTRNQVTNMQDKSSLLRHEEERC